MTPEEERAFYTERARTGPLGAWWTEVEAQSRARAGAEPSDDAPGVVPASLGGEKGSVQKPFIRYAIDAGWTYLAPEEAMNLRRGVTSPVLDPFSSISSSGSTPESWITCEPRTSSSG